MSHIISPFKITKNHVKLLRRMYTSWDDCEFGSPEIDPKRPYGNSDVHQDMLEILGLRELKEGIYEFKLNSRKWLLKGEDEYNIDLEGVDEDALKEELDKLHAEMETVLQILLRVGTLPVGVYESDECNENWKLTR